jgi:hypothetical protein
MNVTRKMTSKAKLSGRQIRYLLLIALVVLIVALLWFAPASKMDTAQRVVKEIRDYETAHNRLPDSLNEIRETEGKPVHYQKLDERSFKVWYQANADETEVYDSVSNTWFRQP